MNISASFQAIKDILDTCPSIQKVFKGEPKSFKGQSPVVTIKFGGFAHSPLTNEIASDIYTFIVTLYVKWTDDENLCEVKMVGILENELAPVLEANKSLNSTVTSAVLGDGDAGVRRIIGETYRYVDCVLSAYYAT